MDTTNMLTKLLILIITLNIILFADEPWFRFIEENNNSELIGFKNREGKVMIEPKFITFMVANRFDNIMAVIEDKNESYDAYYLLKSGKKVAHDSLYMFDNTPDCESEGYIRFQDKNTTLVGMLNSEGEAIIPTEYNALTPIKNGMIVALKGAKKSYLDKHKNSCNHFSFVGGKRYLLDKNNKILIQDFNGSSELNFFSLKITKSALNEKNRENFLGVDGQYYSFINYEKEFKTWFFKELVKDFSKEKFLSVVAKKVIYWDEKDGWKAIENQKFVNQNFDVVKKLFNYVQKKDAKYFIGSESFMIKPLSEFELYFNSCLDLEVSKYPQYAIVITYNKGFGEQDSFSFLKTENGYKLVNVTLKTKIKK